MKTAELDAYFESAIIVKLYVQEATSANAIRLVDGYVPPYALTQWQLPPSIKSATRALRAYWR